MISDEARQILNSEAFTAAFDETHEFYLARLKADPLNDTEAAMALSVLDRVRGQLESYLVDEKLKT